jgi:predicted hydrolase (HD superfamily)
MGKVKVMIDVDDAARLAEEKLSAPLPRRWRHVKSVARRARWVAKELCLPDDLVAAAWLHDIGYTPELAETGFHPLDGARYLRLEGVDEQVVSLVAYHSCAVVEAEVRGLGSELRAEFSPADPLLSDALLYCDMTTGPDGVFVRPAERLVEIRGRYGPDHEVTRFVERAASEILTTAARIEEMLAAQPR